MVAIKKALDGLSRRLFFTIITIIQFTVSFSLLYNMLYISNNVNSVNKKIINSFGNGSMYYLENNEDYADKLYNKDKYDKYIASFNYLENNDKFRFISMQSENFKIKDFKDSINYTNAQDFVDTIDNNKYILLESYEVNDKFLDFFKFNVESGRKFSKDDYEEKSLDEPLPIILGNNYKKVFKINDTVNYYDYLYSRVRKAKVIGFLEKDEYIINRPILMENILNLNNIVLQPFRQVNINFMDTSIKKNQDNIKLYYYKAITESYISVDRENPIIFTDINKEFEKNNFFDITFRNINRSIEQFKRYYNTEITIVTSIFIMTFIFSFIGVILNTLNSIDNRFKEFGVYFLSGAALNDISKIILYEIGILFFTSSILSYVGIKVLEMQRFVKFSLVLFTELSVCILILMVLASIIPLYRIKKLEVNTLLRREK